VIKKKSEKWRMLTDLQNINKIIQPMSPLQPALPQPAIIPLSWKHNYTFKGLFLYTFNLKIKIFTFSIPSINNQDQ
jgi:hypothetical protein